MMRPLNVVLLSADEPENTDLQRILGEYAVLTPVNSLAQLQSVLKFGEYDAVFCEWSYHEGTWKTALNRLRQRCPDVPVIVFCGTGGEREWAEVLEAGAFDLLSLPYRHDRVIPLLEHAVASHEARRMHSNAIKEHRLAS